MIQKSELRKKLLQIRKSISEERRKEASLLALELLKTKGNTLSFSPIGSEIDLSLLNAQLQQEKRLFLVPYQIDAFFKLPLDPVDCILVPGLGFDRKKNRIGYGKGYYDRLLATIGSHILTIGVGFKEQFVDLSLPVDPWDIPVQELCLI